MKSNGIDLGNDGEGAKAMIVQFWTGPGGSDISSKEPNKIANRQSRGRRASTVSHVFVLGLGPGEFMLKGLLNAL